jgi:hypothetical protein
MFLENKIKACKCLEKTCFALNIKKFEGFKVLNSEKRKWNIPTPKNLLGCLQPRMLKPDRRTHDRLTLGRFTHSRLTHEIDSRTVGAIMMNSGMVGSTWRFTHGRLKMEVHA